MASGPAKKISKKVEIYALPAAGGDFGRNDGQTAAQRV